MNKVIESFNEARKTLNKFVADYTNVFRVEQFIKFVSMCYVVKGNVLICGNGGSHASALHFSEELTGRFKADREPLGAIALGEATHTTCVTNDYGFDQVFARQVKALGRTNDLLVVLSTSGNSENVVRAVEEAKKKGIFTIGLLGKDGGKLKTLVDLPIVVDSCSTARIQEVHMWILHTVVELVEDKLKLVD